jgi:uncharacterized protein (TIGR02996 family)
MTTSTDHQRSQLLAAVLAEPDDETPRLVYADWLQEQGDPRGELVTIQCELARLGADAPGERANALRLRERDLLKRHRKAWFEPLVGRQRLEDCQIKSGFLHTITMRCVELAERGPALFAAEPVYRVHLTDPAVDVVGASPMAARLRALDLRNVRLGERGVRALCAATFSALEELDLVLCRLGAKGTRTLAEVAQPQRLPSLRALHLANNGMGDPGAIALSRAPILGSLRELHLGMNAIGPAGARALAASPYLNDVVRLRMWMNPLGEGLGVLRERYGERVEADDD